MDAPIFPTVTVTLDDGQTREQAADLMIRNPDKELTVPFNERPVLEAAVLTEGTEYRITPTVWGWSWQQRPAGTNDPWLSVGLIWNPPDYLASKDPQIIRRNRVAWHIQAAPFIEKPAGTCDP